MYRFEKLRVYNDTLSLIEKICTLVDKLFKVEIDEILINCELVGKELNALIKPLAKE